MGQIYFNIVKVPCIEDMGRNRYPSSDPLRKFVPFFETGVVLTCICIVFIQNFQLRKKPDSVLVEEIRDLLYFYQHWPMDDYTNFLLTTEFLV